MTPEELEQRLADIPAGSTMVLDAGSDPTTGERGARRMMPRPGAYDCVRDCGRQTVMPGICATCGGKERQAEARAEFAAALGSIPDAFRWAAPRAEDLCKRARALETRSGARAPGDLAERIAIGVGTGRSPFWTLRGPTKTGKTSIACAAMVALIEVGIAAWLAAPVPGSRRQATLDPAAVRIARGTRFIPAIDLVLPQDRNDDRPAMFGAALRATVLFLDDVGKEISSRADAATSAARAAATREVIEQRWYWGRPTVITLDVSNDDFVRNYDGGTFRRISEDERVKFLDWS